MKILKTNQMTRFLALFFLFVIGLTTVKGQCEINENNIYSFSLNDNIYLLVKEAKSWGDASACAKARNGRLAHINSNDEQNLIYDELKKAEINLNGTIATDGGGASYVWLGGHDLKFEGKWIWDGDNDKEGPQFWEGKADGMAVDGRYSNWGIEPDDFGGKQDGLGIALTQWPINTGSLGSAGKWNDIDTKNLLYFLIEINDATSGIEKNQLLESFKVNPNPAVNKLNVQIPNNIANANLYLTNLNGQIIQQYKLKNNQSYHEFILESQIVTGTYHLNLVSPNHHLIRTVLIKN